MKNLLIVSISISLAIFFYPRTSNSNSTGSPGGKTGSPTDNASCTGCHSLGNGIGSATITSNISSSGYIPNQFYTITAEVNEPGITKFGFEITSEEVASGSKTGNWAVTNSNETQFTNNSSAITHTAGGSSGNNNSKSWSMDWQAPSGGTGDITFYAAFLATNANGSPLGDIYHTAIYTVSEATVTSTRDLSYKNEFIFNYRNKVIESNSPISIFDTNGKLILNTKNNSTNISHLNSGVYILRSLQKSEKIILN